MVRRHIVIGQGSDFLRKANGDLGARELNTNNILGERNSYKVMLISMVTSMTDMFERLLLGHIHREQVLLV